MSMIVPSPLTETDVVVSGKLGKLGDGSDGSGAGSATETLTERIFGKNSA